MIRNVKMILYSLLFVCSYASADLITIYNTTTRDLCVAVYYLQMMASTHNAQRQFLILLPVRLLK